MRICFKDWHALGDACETLMALKDFHFSNPGVGIGYEGFGSELYQNIPWINPGINSANAERTIQITMDLINGCNANGVHVVHAIEMDIMRETGLYIRPGKMELPIEFTKEEKEDTSLQRDNGIPDDGYWIVDAGGKQDFTTKHYPFSFFQKIVTETAPQIKWVQIGKSEHIHRPLDNAINMLDKTDIRQLCRLIYRSAGVLTPISAPLHLATMPWHRHSRPRPCVVLAGGREPVSFTQYPNHHAFSSVGCEKCCERGGCWKAHVEPANDQDKSVCERPVDVMGQKVGVCMFRISPSEVISKIKALHSIELP